MLGRATPSRALEAEEQLKQALKVQPDASRVLNRYALFQERVRGNIPEAEKAFEKVGGAPLLWSASFLSCPHLLLSSSSLVVASTIVACLTLLLSLSCASLAPGSSSLSLLPPPPSLLCLLRSIACS